MPVAQIGNIRTRIFSSSTWVTVQSCQGLEKPSVFKSCVEIVAALSRHLCRKIAPINIIMKILKYSFFGSEDEYCYFSYHLIKPYNASFDWTTSIKLHSHKLAMILKQNLQQANYMTGLRITNPHYWLSFVKQHNKQKFKLHVMEVFGLQIS